MVTDENPAHLRVDAAVELPPGAEVQITIKYRPTADSLLKRQVINLNGGSEPSRETIQVDLESIPLQFKFLDWLHSIMPSSNLQLDISAKMLIGAVIVYYLIRLIRLSDFPIFFFADEAVHTMLANDLVRDGLKGLGGEILPTFFRSGETYNAGFPVYLQVIPVLLGLRSVFVTRFVSVTVTLLAAIGTGIIFSDVHNNRRGWLAVLVLSIIPAWFYHSRTAFETVEAVSFFAIFLMGYLKYRNGNQQWLIASVVSAALAFYSYSPARVVIAVTGVFLLFSDLQYHWKMRQTLWKPFLVGVFLILPYLRFLYLHPDENQKHLFLLNSYWVERQPFTWKILTFLKIYLQGLNPFYWYLNNNVDISRHIMKGMGHLGWFFLPFFIMGLIHAIKQWKNPGYRLLIFAMLAAPAGAAVVEIGITRAMFMVVPAALFSAMGLDITINWLQRKLRIQKTIEVFLFILVGLYNFAFLDVVLTQGPFWFTSYGMDGMQYGGEQVFSRIKEIQQKNPGTPMVLSPDWANGTDTLARFHLGDPVTIELSSLDAYIMDQQSFPENTIFILPPDDFNKVVKSGKFDPMKVVDVIFYPDGTPGFIFANLKYNAIAKNEFDREFLSRKNLDTSEVSFNGEKITVASSRLDMGPIQGAFDHDPQTIIRTLEANPLVIEISFLNPRTYTKASFGIGGSATKINLYAIPEGSGSPLETSISVQKSQVTRQVTLPFPTQKAISRMRIEVKTIPDGEPAHVHLWDISLQ